MKRIGLVLFVGALLIAALLFLNNTAALAPPMSGKPELLAHRGMAQTFHHEGLTKDTCTAERIYPPVHGYLENTIPSIRAAFDAGADVVEFDVQPTSDGRFAVFHDWTIDCRTEGKGVTREHTLAELQALDIGYGYTADGGKTFPFRGKGVGMMPSLDDVLAAFPDKRFLINIKGNDPAEGELLAKRLAALAPEQRQRLMAYGGALPIAALHTSLPELKVLSKATLKRCAIAYVGVGWSGYVPEACRNTLLLIPNNYAPFVWGWPNRFLDRMRSADTAVFVAGDYSKEDAGSSGIDDSAALAQLPARYDGGILTNRVDLIAPLVRSAAP